MNFSFPNKNVILPNESTVALCNEVSDAMSTRLKLTITCLVLNACNLNHLQSLLFLLFFTWRNSPCGAGPTRYRGFTITFF